MEFLLPIKKFKYHITLYDHLTNPKFFTSERSSEKQKIEILTSEKMVFKTSTAHKLVNKQMLIIFVTVTYKLNKIRVVKLSKKGNLSL